MAELQTSLQHVKVNVWVLVIALLTKLEQQRFTISEVAADWHEQMIAYRGALCGHPLPAAQHTGIPPPQSAH